MSKDEKWREITWHGLAGWYAVSDFGRVMTLHKRHRGLMMRPFVTKRGYRKLSLCAPGKQKKCVYVHRLVLEAFVGKCPAGMECAHRDSNPANNRLSNLMWTLPKINHSHKIARGTSGKGEKNSMAILTPKNVREIRRRRKTGESVTSLANAFGVSLASISNISYRKSWKHI